MPPFRNHIPHVFGTCAGPKMGHVHAWRIVALVQHAQASCEVSTCEKPRDHVSTSRAPLKLG